MTEPAITVRAFFERARAGQLVAIRCGSCGELAIPPKELCPKCHARAWREEPLARGAAHEGAGAQMVE